jgi:hypothetical protein
VIIEYIYYFIDVDVDIDIEGVEGVKEWFIFLPIIS